jgi:hypothetical protein
MNTQTVAKETVSQKFVRLFSLRDILNEQDFDCEKAQKFAKKLNEKHESLVKACEQRQNTIDNCKSARVSRKEGGFKNYAKRAQKLVDQIVSNSALTELHNGAAAFAQQVAIFYRPCSDDIVKSKDARTQLRDINDKKTALSKYISLINKKITKIDKQNAKELKIAERNAKKLIN